MNFNEQLRREMAEKGPEAAKKWHSQLLGKRYPSACPKCGNVDNLTEAETKKTVHCQRCYYHYAYEEATE
jgi:hypothetical protein